MRTGKKKLVFGKYSILWEKKQGPAIFLSLSGQPREALLELDINKLNSGNGVENILAKLDTIFKRCALFRLRGI